MQLMLFQSKKCLVSDGTTARVVIQKNASIKTKSKYQPQSGRDLSSGKSNKPAGEVDT